MDKIHKAVLGFTVGPANFAMLLLIFFGVNNAGSQLIPCPQVAQFPYDSYLMGHVQFMYNVTKCNLTNIQMISLSFCQIALVAQVKLFHDCLESLCTCVAFSRARYHASHYLSQVKQVPVCIRTRGARECYTGT